MAFFTTDFNEIDISTAWETQSKELRAKRLQNQNDLLFTVVRNDIFSRRAEIHADLMTVAQTAMEPNGLSIPLWTYKTARYVKPLKTIVGTQDFGDTEYCLRRTGGEWFIGIRRCDESPLHKYYEEGWDSIWRWRSPKSVDEVVRHTDFMNRIALLFGDYHYRVSKQVVRRTVVKEPLEVVVEDVELTLHYWPRGTPQNVRDSLRKTKAKYETHVPAEMPWVLQPYVWKGALPVVPPSPVPHSVPSSPPPLVRQSNGRVLNPEDMREVARTLFEAEGAVGSYPPPPCYCGYHCEPDTTCDNCESNSDSE